MPISHSRWSEMSTPRIPTRSTRSKALAIDLPWAVANQISMPIASSATPAVATRRMTRGASNSGRMMIRSVRNPISAATTSAPSSATQYGTWKSSRYRAKRATVPNSPWAKLNTPLDL